MEHTLSFWQVSTHLPPGAGLPLIFGAALLLFAAHRLNSGGLRFDGFVTALGITAIVAVMVTSGLQLMTAVNVSDAIIMAWAAVAARRLGRAVLSLARGVVPKT
jgi:hypothetical protein